MRIQIRTRYHGPVGLRGARIVATGAGRRATVTYDHGLRDPHLPAAELLAERLGLDPHSVRYAATGVGGNLYNVTLPADPAVFPDMGAGFLHMGETSQDSDGTYGVACRCGWTSHGHAGRNAARIAGDAHLAVANAPAAGAK